MEKKKGRRRTTTTTTTITIEDLSDDLTVKILGYLPISSIIRCFDVCKRWRSLLTSNPFFLTDTINVAETYHGHDKYMVLERGGMPQASKLDFSFHFPSKKQYKRRILTCCNGLLFSAYFIGRRDHLTQCFISNPWTNECFRLPNKSFELSRFSHCGLAFENNSGDNNNNNVASYKVVIPYSLFPYHNCFDIYSSDKKRWQRLRKKSKVLPHCYCRLDHIGVYCNRVLYWKCNMKPRGRKQHALMLNVETETPGYLYLPSDNADDERILPGLEWVYLIGCKLTECDGQLRYIRIFHARGRLTIWKMSTRRSGKWLKLHNVDFKGAMEGSLGLFPLHGQGIKLHAIMPIGMSLEGDDKVLLNCANRRIVSYDLKKGVFQLILEKEPQDRMYMWQFFRYIPTTKFISERKYIWCLSKKKYMRKEVSTSAPNYANQRPKAYWSPQRHQIFVQLCVEQVHKGNQPTHCFNQAGWEAIIEGFTQTTGLHYDKKTMKYHYDSTKRLWKAWKDLIGKSGMGFDPILRTITAPDEAWAAYIQANPRAAQLRNRPLEFEDQLDIIFGGTTMTKDKAWAPSSGVLPNNVVNITQGSQDPFSIQIGTPERHLLSLEETSASTSMAHHEVDMVDNNHRNSNLGMKRSMEPTSSSSRNSKRVAEGDSAKMTD